VGGQVGEFVEWKGGRQAVIFFARVAGWEGWRRSVRGENFLGG
jgi:hypothetical protein